MSEESKQDRLRSLGVLIRTTRELLGERAEGIDHWEARVRRLEAEGQERVRVAVCGTVKSGKTTVVNALIGSDLLKRGAGIITSLVTRVRAGEVMRARLGLKGWRDVGREVTDAAMFLGTATEGQMADLRREDSRRALQGALEGLGEEAYAEGGYFDKNVALLGAYLDGYERVSPLVEENGHTIEFAEDQFPCHREFAGLDALAVYVDDLVLEIPGLPFTGAFEIGDCQGYDSPNPRHMEKVQEYLMGAHLVLYVVSSRVGLREADHRFIRDIKAMGLLEATHFLLNVDLGEISAVADLAAVRERITAELKGLAGSVPLHTVCALRSLLLDARESGEELSRKDDLLLEVWNESPAVAEDRFGEFREFLRREIVDHRRDRISRAREAVFLQAADTLRVKVGAALAFAGREVEDFAAEQQALRKAREQVETSLQGFANTLQAVTAETRKEAFREIDAAFHPSGGDLAEEVVQAVRNLPLPDHALEVADPKRIFRQMARIYHEMRAAFQRHKVETVNPRAVDRIRAIWNRASERLAAAAGPPTELLIQSVEAYRAEARALGVEVPALVLPSLAAAIGKRPIPLFSAVTYGDAASGPERLLGFAGQWTRRFATGWARRLTGREERLGFARSALSDGAGAVRRLLEEEARSSLLHYNETLKYQVITKSADELAEAWIQTYRETVEALVVDLDQIARRLDEEGAGRGDLIPRLQGILHALEPLAA